MAAEHVAADVSERTPRPGLRIALVLSTAALIAGGFAGCASIGPTGAVTPNALEGSDRVVWDCGWRTMP